MALYFHILNLDDDKTFNYILSTILVIDIVKSNH